MEGEIVYYDQAELDDFYRERPELIEDTISPLGQIYAEWNTIQRATIDEYDRRRRELENYEPREVKWRKRRKVAGGGPARPTSSQRSEDAQITIAYVSIDSGDEELTAAGSLA